MITALHHLAKCNIMHADIKPDNILLSADQKSVRLADLGTGVDVTEPQEITPYLVGRFYRAPEIILGCKPGFPIDMWAMGCSFFEIFTGKILFRGKNNNDLLWEIMKLK